LTRNENFNKLYITYKNLVFKVAYQYSGDYSLAEDITQNTFLQLYRYLDEMNQNNIQSWLFTTAKHYALNHKRKIQREVLQESVGDETVDILETSITSAEKEFMEIQAEAQRRQLHEDILCALLHKNPRWYEAVTLVYFMEVPQAKVAEEMGIRIEVLHSLLHRARCWIKKRFATEYAELKNEEK